MQFDVVFSTISTVEPRDPQAQPCLLKTFKLDSTKDVIEGYKIVLQACSNKNMSLTDTLKGMMAGYKCDYLDLVEDILNKMTFQGYLADQLEKIKSLRMFADRYRGPEAIQNQIKEQLQVTKRLLKERL